MQKVECSIPVSVFADTQEGLSEFLTCLEWVWEGLDQDFLTIVQGKLQRICFSSDEVFVDPEKNAAAITLDLGNGSSEIRFWNQATVGSTRHCKNLVAHELRHSWQFATNHKESPEFTEKVARMIWEADAIRFAAEKVAKESNFCMLKDAGLPTDDNFDRLVDHWPILIEEERLKVLELVAGFASVRRHESRR